MALFSTPAAGPPHPSRSDAATAAESLAKRIVLVEPPGLFRDGLAHVFETFLEEVRVECYDEAADVAGGPASLCLIGLAACAADRDALLSTINALRALCGDAPIGAVIPDERSPLAQSLAALGVVGVISRAAGLAVAVAATRLMSLGGYCLPPGLSLSPDDCPVSGVAKACARRAGDGEGRLGGVRPLCRYELTARECDVLQSLRAGHPNKIIAFELGISESTVKVHLRNIMKKLRASNRTQVALGASLPCDGTAPPDRPAAAARHAAEEANAPPSAAVPLANRRERATRLPV
jgi:DNA-binding NarL/FixJ family response regulator